MLAPRGDEFAIILDNCAEERALLIGNQLLKALNSLEIEWQSANYAIGASIGLAVGTMDMGDAQAWLEAADGACYIAKRTGLANSEARHARKTMCSRSSKGRELLLAADSDRAPWSRSLGSKVGAPGWWMMVRTHPCVRLYRHRRHPDDHIRAAGRPSYYDSSPARRRRSQYAHWQNDIDGASLARRRELAKRCRAPSRWKGTTVRGLRAK